MKSQANSNVIIVVTAFYSLSQNHTDEKDEGKLQRKSRRLCGEMYPESYIGSNGAHTAARVPVHMFCMHAQIPQVGVWEVSRVSERV